MRHLTALLFGLLYITSMFAETVQVNSGFQPPLQKEVQNGAKFPSEWAIVKIEDELFLHADGFSGSVNFNLDGDVLPMDFTDGYAQLEIGLTTQGNLISLMPVTESRSHAVKIYHISIDEEEGCRIRYIPLWLSIMPPLIAIILALIFKEVIVSLFTGIWLGAFIAGGLRIDGFFQIVFSFFQVLQKYMIEALSDTGHLSVILFSLLIGGMVALISKNGGMAGIVAKLSYWAKDRVSSQIVTWILGIAIFFDDYANTLIVGNTVRSVTDKFKVSREKLAYIVDSTAAPVSAVALITTWIGAELGFIESGIRLIDGFGDHATAYSLFLASLKYSFYPVLTLIFVFLLIRSKRDFGPMYKAECRAIQTGQLVSNDQLKNDEENMENLEPLAKAPKIWHHAGIPVLLVILMTIAGLIYTGFEGSFLALQENGRIVGHSWGDIWLHLPAITGDEQAGFVQKLGILVGKSDSYQALIWASFTGVFSAMLITIWNKVMTLKESMYWMTTGFKTMLPAIIILVLAWSLAIVTDELRTADFITLAIGGHVSPYFMPPLIFVLAALISFSTGSSWSTMAILYPIAMPTTWALCEMAGLSSGVSHELMLNVIATVLAASVLGDHCSPISDTTILSSLASDCNHIDHVKTQMPYALTVGAISLFCTSTVNLIGGSWFTSALLVLVSVGAFLFILKKFGQAHEIRSTIT